MILFLIIIAIKQTLVKAIECNYKQYCQSISDLNI